MPGSHQTSHTQHTWAGSLALAPGIGVFKGRAANHQTHQHWAHQLAIGLEGLVEMRSGERTLRAPCLFVWAGAPHSLTAASLVSVFLDPTTTLAQGLCRQIDPAQPVCELPPALVALFQEALLAGDLAPDLALRHLQTSLEPMRVRSTDARMQSVTAALAQSDACTSAHSRARLSALVGLSETRFSHWFREQTGMPLRSYRKWLRLVRALEYALRGGSLTEAAHLAAFADQAHFSRTFLQMFGVRPSDLVSSIHLGVAPRGELAAPAADTSFALTP